jgi:hypothetical protein
VHKYLKEEIIMAWKRVQVRTIPEGGATPGTAESDFEKMSDEVMSYIKTNYDDTGKRTSFSLSSSDDGLVLTYTSVFRDEASKNEMLSDSTIAAEITRRDNLNAAAGITKEVTLDEEV